MVFAPDNPATILASSSVSSELISAACGGQTWSKKMSVQRATNYFLLVVFGVHYCIATEVIVLQKNFHCIFDFPKPYLLSSSQALPDFAHIVPFFQQLVHAPSTLDGYSFSNRLEVSKSVKGSKFGIPDGRLSVRARQRGGNAIESTVSYNTAVKGVAVMAQVEAGGAFHMFIRSAASNRAFHRCHSSPPSGLFRYRDAPAFPAAFHSHPRALPPRVGLRLNPPNSHLAGR